MKYVICFGQNIPWKNYFHIVKALLEIAILLGDYVIKKNWIETKILVVLNKTDSIMKIFEIILLLQQKILSSLVDRNLNI